MNKELLIKLQKDKSHKMLADADEIMLGYAAFIERSE